jgi:hypothetical protein
LGFGRAFQSPDRDDISPVFVAAAARAALLAGNYPAALANYRRLALLIDRIPGSRERSRLLLEASLAVAYAERDSMAEAQAFVRQAQTHFAPLLEPIHLGTEAVATLSSAIFSLSPREGEDGYDALLWIFDRSPPSRGAPLEILPVLPAGGRNLLLAALARTFSDRLAREHFDEFVAYGTGVPPHLAELAHLGGASGTEESEEE